MEASVPDNRILLSTRELDHRDRDALVRDFYGRICMRLDLEALEPGGLSFDAATTVLPALSTSRGSVAPMSWERNRSLMSDANDDLIISWMAGGYRFDRPGRDSIETLPGSACVMTLEQAFRATTFDGSWTYCVQLPRTELEPLVGELGDLSPDAIGRDTPENRLLFDYVRAVNAGPLSPTLAAAASRHIIDLLAVALGANRDAAHVARGRGVRAARLRAIKQFIDEHLASPRLSADTAGKALGLSPRYIRRLFADEGLGFSDYVTRRRLACVRRRLMDPRLASRPIADLAFEVGLVEPSTFYRRYRAEFGMTPSETRLAATAWKGSRH